MICNRCRSRKGRETWIGDTMHYMCRPCWEYRLSNGFFAKSLRFHWVTETFGPLERYTPLTEVGVELNEGKG